MMGEILGIGIGNAAGRVATGAPKGGKHGKLGESTQIPQERPQTEWICRKKSLGSGAGLQDLG